MKAQRALVLGIASGLVVVAGIVMGVLLYQLSVTVLNGIMDTSLDSKYASLRNMEAGPVWIVGLVYVFPGVMCFIAAFIQNKCFYITSCVFSMVSIIIMGLTIVFIGIPVFWVLVVFFNLDKNCIESFEYCECRVDTVEYERTPFRTCEFMRDFTNLGIGLAVVIIIAWIFLVAAFVIACVYACRSKQTTGTVMAPAQQPMLQG